MWREALLARAVLQNLTRGYIHHPQLERFKTQADPAVAMNAYLKPVLEEATRRGYQFDASKIFPGQDDFNIPVTVGQLFYELEHLRKKLAQRDPPRFQFLRSLSRPEPHPIFTVVPGEIEKWEKRQPTGLP